jgi:hypothetical protein
LLNASFFVVEKVIASDSYRSGSIRIVIASDSDHFNHMDIVASDLVIGRGTSEPLLFLIVIAMRG